MVEMLITLQDLVDSCPLQKWVDHIHTIQVDIPTGGSIVVRGKFADFVGFQCTQDMVRATGLMENKHNDILDALCDLVNENVLIMADHQGKIAECVSAILVDLRNNHLTYQIMLIMANVMSDILADYQPHADLVGWAKWLKMCVYFTQQ